MTGTDSRLEALIRDVPDFPKPGILFKDITPLLGRPEAFRIVIDRMADRFRDHAIDMIAAPEARGFVFGAPLAMALGVGFVPIRKPGKLPYSTISLDYDLEYGRDSVHIHSDALTSGKRVLLVDDVLATGGTMAACRRLVEQTGAVVPAFSFLMELSFLGGRAKLEGYDIFSVLTY